MEQVEKSTRMRKYISEFMGTLILTLFGCGTAVLTGGLFGIGSIFNIITTALAFGLSIVVVAYTFGKASGTHVNPAVTFAKWLQKEISLGDMLWYFLCQFAGAFVGAGFVFLFATGIGYMSVGQVSGTMDAFQSMGLGANVSGAFSASYTGSWGYSLGNFAGWMLPISVVVELVLTFVFVSVVLFATEKENKYAGLLIGGALTFVHLLGIAGPTGTSVNPARSFGPAMWELFRGNWVPVADLWLFLLVPIAGAVLAWLFHKFMNYMKIRKPKEETAAAAEVEAKEEPEVKE